jgi:hypothetical protein
MGIAREYGSRVSNCSAAWDDGDVFDFGNV